MKKMNDAQTDESLNDFLDYENYDIKYLRGPAEKNQTKVVETLKSLGFEIYPHVVTTGENENTIYYRKAR